MGLFSDRKQVPAFTSRAEAFDYLFAELVNKGVDMMEAAEKANAFADIISTNKGLPPTPPKPQNGIEKAVGYVRQIATLKQENPEVWELLTGAIGGLFSGFAVLTSPRQSPQMESPSAVEEIDFETLK